MVQVVVYPCLYFLLYSPYITACTSLYKIYVEIERARLTMKLSKIKEAEGKLAEAADVLQELQVRGNGVAVPLPPCIVTR